jgi:Flp pilus assembly protein TadG
MVGTRRRARRSEEGAVAVMVALSLTALLVVAGLVVNLGQARVEKTTNRTYSDGAASAGIRGLDVAGDGTSKPWAGVCQALAYLQASNPSFSGMSPSWRNGNGTAIATDPCAAGSPLLNTPCVDAPAANYLTSWASYRGISASGLITVDINSGYAMPDPNFPTDTSADNSATGGCDQLAVIIHQSESAGLANAGNPPPSALVTVVRSVARMTAASGGNASAALLILERTDCTAISVNSNNTFIQVKGFGAMPGVIHSDSNGSGPACLPVNPAILGKFAGPPGISARQSETGSPLLPGLITTVAGSGASGAVSANATDGATKVCAELATPTSPSSSPPTVCGPATGRALVGRGVVDRRYNNTNTTGVKLAMSTAATEYNKVPTGKAPNEVLTGYTVVGGTKTDCQNVANPSYAQGGAIFVDCPNGVTYNDFTFTNATSVVFNGDVSVGSGNTLSMPNVTRVYVKGSTATNGGLISSGTLNLNLGSSATCASRTTATNAQIVVGNGRFSGGAQSAFHLCQTTVLLTNDQTPTACPVPSAPVAGTGQAPYDNACGGYVDVNAGGAMDWTAPNKYGANPGQAAWDNLEDLALWTEASHVSSIGGGASMDITGVFFLPNANPFIISGHGNQSIAANAQFVARKLSVQGQGTLYMRPNPDDSFTLPVISDSYSLVR